MKKIAALFLAAVLILAAAAAWDHSESRKSYSGIRIENSDAVAEKIRTGLLHRAWKLHISFRAHTNDEEAIKALVDDLLEKALGESDDPTGGDYIRYQLGGYTMNYDVEKEFFGWRYYMELMPTYYSTREEEDYVDGKVEEILRSLAAEGLGEKEKIRKVHDYVVSLLTYDSVHKANTKNHKKTTAYAALRYHQAVCQGYAVLTYRLLKELGVACRIMTGDAVVGGVTERHAWLLVHTADGDFYLDPTLDDVYGSYDWYMKTAEEFAADHTL